MRLEGESEVSAVGGSVSGATVSNMCLGFAEVNLENQILAALPLGGVEPLTGRAVDGVLGGDFFARFVVEVDYEAKIISLYEPQNYKYSGNGNSIPILLNERTPFAHAKIVTPAGTVLDGTFEIDTGSSHAVQLAGPFVQAHNLLGGNQPSIPGPGAVEAGGKTSQRIGRLDRLEIGRVGMSKPIASFSQDAEGELAHAEYSGVVGAKFLSRFRVILDYSRQRMILEPNRHRADPDEYDMSGMDLIAEGPDFKIFRVREILADSPAAECGLRKSDVIVAVDGKPASTLSLNQIEQLFRQHNRAYQLRIRRDEKLQWSTIRLRRLI